MANIIEVEISSYPKARFFLNALFYSDSVSLVGFRSEGEMFVAVILNLVTDEENELDERFPSLISDVLQTGNDLDEISAYCRVFSRTSYYNAEWQSD